MDSSAAVNPSAAGVLALVSDLQDQTVLSAHFPKKLKARSTGL